MLCQTTDDTVQFLRFYQLPISKKVLVHPYFTNLVPMLCELTNEISKYTIYCECATSID
jgi:hypothetical protein